MSVVLIAGGALALGTTIYKGVQGANQLSKANAIHPLDPGYQINPDIIANAKNLSAHYNNFVMPGYNSAKNDINTSYGSALGTVREGASSSGDILDAANKLQFNRDRAVTSLNTASAQAKENLLPQVVAATDAAGNQQVLKNQFDNNRYDQQVAAKAALVQAGQTNIYGAMDSAGKLGSAFLNYNSPATTATGPATGTNPVKYSSMFDSGMATLNGYSKQKINAANNGFINYMDPNMVA